MKKLIAARRYTRTNPSTASGIIELHAEAVRALNEVFEEGDRLNID